MTFYADENINDGVDQSDRVNEDILSTRVPHTGNACKYGYVFIQGGMIHV